MTITRSCTDLYLFTSFEERYNYLRLKAGVGVDTFGHERYLNQRFYTSREWKLVRNQVITRDRGCDLGVPGREIIGRIIVHHMNPMTPGSIAQAEGHILEPEFLISCSHATHNAIHYGELSVASGDVHDQLIERTLHDTSPWR